MKLKEEVNDYVGRLIKKSACSNPNSKFHPTLDHKDHYHKMVLMS